MCIHNLCFTGRSGRSVSFFRAESSVTLTNESISQSPSNSHSDNESEFARLGDMSVGSPPDSEFFSILPQQFGDGSLPQSVNQKENVSTSASPVVIPESFESPKSFRRVNSGLNVGSIDSNSFHKVDGKDPPHTFPLLCHSHFLSIFCESDTLVRYLQTMV